MNPLPVLLRRSTAREVARELRVDRSHLAAYGRVCGFRLRDELPPTYPHVLAFPAALEVMTGPAVPFGVLGLVHVRNRIEVLRRLSADDALSARVWVDGLEGSEFDVVAEVSASGAVAWRGRSTYRHVKGDGGRRGGRGGDEPPEATAVWVVPRDTGRRYARVSGDWNPIHLNPLAARLFGMPGAIAHGMWTKARCLAALDGSLGDAFAVDVRFKKPLVLPARVGFSYRDGEIAVHDLHSGVPFLTGTAHLGGEV
jgi:MaoC like domain